MQGSEAFERAELIDKRPKRQCRSHCQVLDRYGGIDTRGATKSVFQQSQRIKLSSIYFPVGNRVVAGLNEGLAGAFQRS